MTKNDRVALYFAVSYTIDGLRDKLLPVMAASKESLFPRMTLLLDQLEVIKTRLDAMEARERAAVVGTSVVNSGIAQGRTEG